MKPPLLLTVLLTISVTARAEQGCPDGMFPGGMQPNGPICVPMPGAGGGGAHERPVERRAARWEDRWGAIATDGKNGYMGVAVGQPSKNMAQAAALTECRYYGGTECVVTISYANQCTVLATGNNWFVTKAAPTLTEARSAAMQECERAGMVCKIPYSACSLAQRVD